MKRWFNAFLSLFVVAGFIFTTASNVSAEETSPEKVKVVEKKKHKQHKKKQPDNSKTPAGWTKGDKKGWDGGTQPPGFDKGDKTGWNGGTMPPGLSGEIPNNNGGLGVPSGGSNEGSSGRAHSGGHGRK